MRAWKSKRWLFLLTFSWAKLSKILKKTSSASKSKQRNASLTQRLLSSRPESVLSNRADLQPGILLILKTKTFIISLKIRRLLQKKTLPSQAAATLPLIGPWNSNTLQRACISFTAAISSAQWKETSKSFAKARFQFILRTRLPHLTNLKTASLV